MKSFAAVNELARFIRISAKVITALPRFPRRVQEPTRRLHYSIQSKSYTSSGIGRGHPLSGAKEMWMAPFVPSSSVLLRVAPFVLSP